MNQKYHQIISIILLAFLCSSVEVVRADRFVIVNEKGEKRELIGRIYASGQGAYAIEKPTGEMELVAQGAVLERDNKVEWQAATPKEVAQKLSDQFGAEKFRTHIEGNFVIGLVLMGDVPKKTETRVLGFLKKAAKFMNNVQTIFLKFAKKLSIDVKDPDYPLVLLIFESDDDFNTYAESLRDGNGLSSNNLAGFYYGITNYLAVRMTECNSFEVPLHEAIHQQVFNRGVLQRLAPLPAWFNEGIATGFSADGDRINVGPTKVHFKYAKQVGTAKQLTWAQIIASDQAFHGDVLAGEAYCHAWSLHWLLVTKHPKKYAAYVRHLSTIKPLIKQTPKDRQDDFIKFFGDDLEALHVEFIRALKISMRRQKDKTPVKRNGYLRDQRALADYEIKAMISQNRLSILEVNGRLKNINPFRSLSYSFVVETESGNLAHWVLHNVSFNQVAIIQKKQIDLSVASSLPGVKNSFRVRVRSIPADSEEALRWKRGELPDPKNGR